MPITLGATDIWPLVEGHIYSADMVERPKPAPDLFLHAACSEGSEPANCVLVKDGTTGIRAARAAGMWVVGYSVAETKALAVAGAGTIISGMASLVPLILRGEIA
jgi:beta-phosphoglucomutase-like phosphatase (HAD superfamily)